MLIGRLAQELAQLDNRLAPVSVRQIAPLVRAEMPVVPEHLGE